MFTRKSSLAVLSIAIVALLFLGTGCSDSRYSPSDKSNIIATSRLEQLGLTVPGPGVRQQDEVEWSGEVKYGSYVFETVRVRHFSKVPPDVELIDGDFLYKICLRNPTKEGLAQYMETQHGIVLEESTSPSGITSVPSPAVTK